MNSALITENRLISYVEYDRLIAATVHKLKQAGIKKGDRIAIVSPNCLSYVVLLRALFQIGAIAVPASYRFPAQQINPLLENINCRHGFASGEFCKQQKSSRIIWHEIDGLVTDPGIEKSVVEGFSIEIDKIPQLRDATIIFTSGSASAPKAVLHTFGNHYYSALGSNQNIRFQGGDGWLLALPLYHVGGLAILFRAWISGGAIIIPDNESSLADSIIMSEPSHISLVATQLYRLMREKRVIPHLQKMKAILLGGGSIAHSLIKESLAYQLPIYTSYGSTEMASQITTTAPGDPFEKLFTAGKLLEHRQLKISLDGEILVKGKTLFKGYVEEGKGVTAMNKEGWFATGDLGQLDSDGYLIVSGRKDNMFVSGGENIQPEEIEQELCGLRGVKEAIVVPARNEEFGERPAAFVKIEGKFPEKAYFRNYLSEKLPRFKIPDYFFQFPDSVWKTGIKQNRLLLKEMAERLIREDNNSN